MKKLLFLISILTIIVGCSSENSADCFQTDGSLIQEEVANLDVFKRIIVFDRVKLFISQGPVQRVIVESPDNLINEVIVRVEDSILKLKDNNSCNILREFETTKVYVTSPNIDQIRNSSGSTVEDIGTIGWDGLELVSEDQLVEDEFNIDGDFDLDELDANNITINANGISTFRLKGKTKAFQIGLFDGDARVEAEDLIANSVTIFHRSTNKIICFPTDSIRGRIVSIGDVIAKNRPPFVDVEEFFRGKLIFE